MNFRKVKIGFIENLAYKKKDHVILIRIITGYANTNNRLFKLGIITPLNVHIVTHHKI